MKKVFFLFLFVFAITIDSSFAVEKVTLQLRWDHQFQFAGYYAAKWQGYFKKAGLDVTIKSAVTSKGILSAVEEVSAGRADFGIGAADILVANDKGGDLVVLASLFQHSASAFYTRTDTVLDSPSDLMKLKVARRINDLIDVEFQALLLSEGFDPSRVRPYPHIPGLSHLIDGEVDVVPGYSISLPFDAKEKNIRVNAFKPASYGIDFYGDSLFTHSRKVRENPEMVEKFKVACLKGWKYALNNIEETAGRITEELSRTAPKKNLSTFNIFQSSGVLSLMNYPEVEIGHINPSRWEKMHNYLKLIGLLEKPFKADDFIFDYKKLIVDTSEKSSGAIIFISLFCLFVFIVLVIKLRNGVQRKNRELSAANDKLKEREEQFSLAMEFTNVGVYDWDLETDDVYYSPVWKKMLGYEPDELENRLSVWEKLTAPEDVKVAWEMINEVFEQKRDGFEIEFSMRHKDGSWVDILSRANVVRDETGKAVRVLGTHVDITDRKKTESTLLTNREKLKKQEELFKSVFQNIPVMITIYDAPLKKLIVNKEFEKTTGWLSGDAAHGNLMDKIYSDPKERDEAVLFMKSGSGEWREFEITTKSGAVVQSLWSNLMLDDNRRLCIGLDLTEEKKGKKALFESEMKFKRMFEYAPLSYQSLDRDGNFVDVNDTWLRTMGYSRYEVIGRNFSEFLAPEWTDHFAKNFPRFKAVGEVLGVEFEMIKKDGAVILVTFHGKIGKDQDGDFERTHCVLRDITQQRSSEEALNSELKINKAIAEISKELLEEVYDIKKVSDLTLDYAKELTGSEHGFVASMDKDTMEIIGHSLTEMIAHECGVNGPRIVFSPDNEGKYNALWGHALNTKKAFYTNNPEEHESSTGLPEGHLKIDRYMAVPVMMGRTLLGMVALANSGRDYSEQDILAIQRLADVYALGIHREGYERDRTTLERNMRQLQKKEAIGVLAGGIAHDFNNILFPIVGFAEMLAEDLPEDSPHQEGISEILSGSLRAKDLVRQILAFSRQSEQEVRPIKPQEVVSEAVKLMRATIPTYIKISQNIDPGCRIIMGDETQIHQIVMNLMTNAFQAITDDEGEITVGLTNIEIDDLKPYGKLHPGPYVLLSVGDTGTGMEKADIEKIFDPYFSTKAVDKGTGLGLSVVKGIVENYDGDIIVKSFPDQGSVFEVYLPALDNSQSAQTEQENPDDFSGQERILIIDDEQVILRLVKQILDRLGYGVEVSDSSEKALEKIHEHPDRFDLVLTDMTMPSMTGEKLTQEIKKIKPDLPVIICTGFSDRIDQEKAREIGADGLLYKPVVKADLARIVREVLEKRH